MTDDTLMLHTLSSDDEEETKITTTATVKSKNKKKKKKKKKKGGKQKDNDNDEQQQQQQSSDDDDDDDGSEINEDFEFGGLLGEDGPDPTSRNDSSHFSSLNNNDDGWNFQSALDILTKNDKKQSSPGTTVEKTEVGDIIAAARRNMKKKSKGKADDDDDDDDDDDSSVSSTSTASSTTPPTEPDNIRLTKEQKTTTTTNTASEAAKARAFFSSPTTTSSPNNDDPTTTTTLQFSQLNLSRPLLRAIASLGYTNPTPIQSAVIPSALSSRDICASACTGSGKTAAFLLPLAQRLLNHHSSNRSKRSLGATTGLILTPTRELAAQCVGMWSALTRYCNHLSICLVTGGAKNVERQAMELRRRPDVIVATPGRLIDHVTNSPGVHLDDISYLVLDEADRLLDMGFEDEMVEILKYCPVGERRQTMLFSATMTTRVDDLVKLSLKKPLRVQVAKEVGRIHVDGVEVAPRLEQEFVRVRSGNEDKRESVLLALLERTFREDKVICFFDTKVLCHRFMILCGLRNLKAKEIHGNLTQLQRLEALESFRKGEVNMLLATDVAARGLDIEGVDVVINYEMPSVETYIHRIGRTARAGRSGRSCTLIGEGRRHLMKQIINDDNANDDNDDENENKTKISHGIVKSRTVPQAVIAHFHTLISSLEPSITAVIDAETIARMDRLAEMEATKAVNVIRHHDDIQSRPRKEWFEGDNAKRQREEREAERKLKNLRSAPFEGTHRMTRKKRRAREARLNVLEEQERLKKEAEENGKKGKKIMTDTNIKLSAKASKKREAERQLEKGARSVAEDDELRERKKRQRMEQRMGQQEEEEMKKKKKKAKGVTMMNAVGDGGLFDEEKVMFARKKTTEKKEGDVEKSHYNFTEYDPNKSFGRGGKKGNKKFKSKSKYKRR